MQVSVNNFAFLKNDALLKYDDDFLLPNFAPYEESYFRVFKYDSIF